MNQLLNKTTMVAALLRAVPVGMTVIFVLAVVLMNFLARITLVSLPWLALNAGITVSWVSFLFVDIVTRHFGAKAANMLSVVAIVVNLIVCFFSVLIGRLFDHPSLDMVVGGQWSILLASTIAYLIAALTNNYTNVFLGRRFFRQNPDGRKAFAVRSYISTFLSQCVDNFLFVFLAFVVLPNLPGALPVHWTVAQCVGASVLCAVFELLSEVVFSPLGYHVAQKWKEKNVGKEYLETYCPNGVLES